MALPLTPDQLSRFEDKMVEVDDLVQKVRLLPLNFKDKSGNDTAITAAVAAAKAALDAAAAIVAE